MSHVLLTQYQSIERTSAQMLHAAQRNDWDEVSRLELVCGEQIEHVRQQAQSTPLNPSERAAKQRILLSILRHDAQIRALADPWLAELTPMLSPRPPKRVH